MELSGTGPKKDKKADWGLFLQGIGKKAPAHTIPNETFSKRHGISMAGRAMALRLRL